MMYIYIYINKLFFEEFLFVYDIFIYIIYTCKCNNVYRTFFLWFIYMFLYVIMQLMSFLLVLSFKFTTTKK